MTAEEWDVPLPIEELEPPKPKRAKAKVNAKRAAANAAKIAYRRFRSPSRTLCQDCVDESVVEGKVRFCHQVAYTRTVGDEVRLLCFSHTQQWRDKDGLDALRAGTD